LAGNGKFSVYVRVEHFINQFSYLLFVVFVIILWKRRGLTFLAFQKIIGGPEDEEAIGSGSKCYISETI
jgi:hypothetical protein